MRLLICVALVLVMAVAVGNAPVFAGVTIADNSFEAPNIGTTGSSYVEGSPPTGWTEDQNNGSYGGGYVGNNSAYGNSNAPDGTQALLLKGFGGVQQTLAGTYSGSYTLSLYAEGRTNYNGPDPFKVLINGTALTFGASTTITPPAGVNSYVLYTSSPFTMSTGSLLEILGQSGTQVSPVDNSTFVDLVTVTGTPEPASIVVWGLAIAGGLLVARRRSAYSGERA